MIESNFVSHVQWAIGTCIGQEGKWSISANWQDYSGRNQQSGIDPQKEPRVWTGTLSRERVSPLFHPLKPRPVFSDISWNSPCDTFWVWIVLLRIQADWHLLSWRDWCDSYFPSFRNFSNFGLLAAPIKYYNKDESHCRQKKKNFNINIGLLLLEIVFLKLNILKQHTCLFFEIPNLSKSWINLII